jgi:rubrerythrin
MEPYGLALAIIIPLGWGAIFYPVLRKSRKSWPVLMMIASTLSFSTLVLKEILYKANPVLAETFTYAAGTSLGLAALYIIFKFNSKGLEAVPQDHMFFRNHEIETKIPMRYLFQVALLLEEQGKEFYEKLADKALDVNAKKLWRDLANDEIDHKRLFETALSRWLPRTANKEFLESLIQQLRRAGLFSNPPPPDATEKDVINYAIRQEEKTADFYHSFEKGFPDTWKRMHIQGLVIAEREHANKLRGILPAY